SVLLAMALPAQHRPVAAARPEAPPPAGAAVSPKRLIASRDGHFRARARAEGRDFDVMVDTGATIVALTWQTGLDLN
ncbi:hypothetical protein, partial [Klebsiella michiganensis]|uniref:hypothetical protein n=1 Tax=Klebsiella michiganensis TaxID=1134687 RepID=UPI001954A292